MTKIPGEAVDVCIVDLGIASGGGCIVLGSGKSKGVWSLALIRECHKIACATFRAWPRVDLQALQTRTPGSHIGEKVVRSVGQSHV